MLLTAEHLGVSRASIMRYVVNIEPPMQRIPKRKSEADARARQRKRWTDAGLTTHGKQRINRPRPELRGLDRQSYKRRYMRLVRGAKANP